MQRNTERRGETRQFASQPSETSGAEAGFLSPAPKVGSRLVASRGRDVSAGNGADKPRSGPRTRARHALRRRGSGETRGCRNILVGLIVAPALVLGLAAPASAGPTCMYGPGVTAFGLGSGRADGCSFGGSTYASFLLHATADGFVDRITVSVTDSSGTTVASVTCTGPGRCAREVPATGTGPYTCLAEVRGAAAVWQAACEAKD